jgi:hypothetical protein
MACGWYHVGKTWAPAQQQGQLHYELVGSFSQHTTAVLQDSTFLDGPGLT